MAATTITFTVVDIPKAIALFCTLYPDAVQPSIIDSDVTSDGRHIIIANTTGTLAYMTSRGKFVQRIGGAEIERGQQ